MVKYNLEQMGLKVQNEAPSRSRLRLYDAISTRGADFDAYVGGWVADYPDPFDFINVLLGREATIQAVEQLQLRVLQQREATTSR